MRAADRAAHGLQSSATSGSGSESCRPEVTAVLGPWSPGDRATASGQRGMMGNPPLWHPAPGLAVALWGLRLVDISCRTTLFFLLQGLIPHKNVSSSISHPSCLSLLLESPAWGAWNKLRAEGGGVSRGSPVTMQREEGDWAGSFQLVLAHSTRHPPFLPHRGPAELPQLLVHDQPHSLTHSLTPTTVCSPAPFITPYSLSLCGSAPISSPDTGSGGKEK